MGVDTNLYLGPYVSCTQRLGEKVTKIPACANEKCRDFKRENVRRDGEFCSRCGSKIGEIAKREDALVRFTDVVGDDVLIDLEGNYHDGKSRIVLLGTNASKYAGAPRNFRRDLNDDLHEDLSSIAATVSSEIRWFEDHHADALAKLREAFDDVRICWGLHLYYT